jgi:hypothetical protein
MLSDSSSDRGQYKQVRGLAVAGPPTPRRQDTDRRGQRSWKALSVILASLSAGLGVALAHHFMNVYLDGKPVNKITLSQSWVSRFGTALAFLVKLSFTISVGAAFVQYQWMRFHKESFRIQDVDALTSVLGNFLSFFASSVWFRQPVLLTLGLVSWYELSLFPAAWGLTLIGSYHSLQLLPQVLSLYSPRTPRIQRLCKLHNPFSTMQQTTDICRQGVVAMR